MLGAGRRPATPADIGTTICYYDNGWRYGTLLSFVGKATCRVLHNITGTHRIPAIDVLAEGDVPTPADAPVVTPQGQPSKAARRKR